jgi:hypothetical protein
MLTNSITGRVIGQKVSQCRIKGRKRAVTVGTGNPRRNRSARFGQGVNVGRGHGHAHE